MRLALAGDTMLGRGVAEALRSRSPADLFDEAVVALLLPGAATDHPAAFAAGRDRPGVAYGTLCTHVFHGVADRVLYDLGDFIDDYAVDPRLRNDLGLLWLVTFDAAVPVEVEAVPLALDFARTRAARPEEADWIGRRLRDACAPLGTEVHERGDRFVVDFSPCGRRP